jgi:hypothetical protein
MYLSRCHWKYCRRRHGSFRFKTKTVGLPLSLKSHWKPQLSQTSGISSLWYFVIGNLNCASAPGRKTESTDYPRQPTGTSCRSGNQTLKCYSETRPPQARWSCSLAKFWTCSYLTMRYLKTLSKRMSLILNALLCVTHDLGQGHICVLNLSMLHGSIAWLHWATKLLISSTTPGSRKWKIGPRPLRPGQDGSMRPH